MPKKSIVYIDGLNLYYAAKRYFGKHRKYGWRWLDIQGYFMQLRQNDDLRVIKYFTSLIRGPRVANQKCLLAALRTRPKVKVIQGKFKDKPIERTLHFPGSHITADITIENFEEKRTDVSIAAHMIWDAVFGNCDRLVLVSGDTDLVPALEHVRKVNPAKEICLHIPSALPKHLRKKKQAQELWELADKGKASYLDMELLRQHQLPLQVLSRTGQVIRKPQDW